MSESFRDDGTERDAGLTALYRAAAREEPPAALDDTIRAAARRAVSSRPQRVSSPFVRSWRVPLSIAAVMLLTVSLVTVMREEAPEIMLPPGGERTLGETNHMRAGPAADAGESVTAVPKSLVPRAQRSDSVGLKPPAQTGSSGIGLRDDRVSPDPAPRSRNDMAAAGRMETDAPDAPALAKRATPEASPGTVGTRENKDAVPAEKLRQSAKKEALPPPARAAEAVTRTPAPVPAPAMAPALAAGAAAEGKVEAGGIHPRTDLPPDQWLARIDELRRQGKLEEAKTSLAEFRKRYPDYALPASLKNWAGQ